jgi:hypothetical protein
MFASPKSQKKIDLRETQAEVIDTVLKDWYWVT